MSTFKEDVTEKILSAMQGKGVLCAKFQLMDDFEKEWTKDTLFSAVKEAMEINGYEV